MSLLEIFLIALALSMDAFAVSVTLGLSQDKLKLKHIMLPALFFGFFQALMPLLGFLGGSLLAERIKSFDHWIAFILLSFLGGKMIKDSFSKEERKEENPFLLVKLLLLALATSIDALAAGVTFAFFTINIFYAIMITGFTTFIVSMAGVITGRLFDSSLKSRAELIGGAILIIIGLRMLIEHLFFE